MAMHSSYKMLFRNMARLGVQARNPRVSIHTSSIRDQHPEEEVDVSHQVKKAAAGKFVFEQ